MSLNSRRPGQSAGAIAALTVNSCDVMANRSEISTDIDKLVRLGNSSLG